MTQRRLIYYAGAYLLATALTAWLAFMLGHNHGLRAENLPQSQQYRQFRAYVDTSDNVWSCDQFRGFPGLRANHRERACGPGGGAAAPLAHHAGPISPLQLAVIGKIAGAGRAAEQASLQVPSAPASIGGAHANSGLQSAPPTNPPGGPIASVAGGYGQAPAGGPFSDQPSVLLGGPAAITFDTPPPEVTPIPIPGGLPLMGGALSALFAGRTLRRRVCRRADRG